MTATHAPTPNPAAARAFMKWLDPEAPFFTLQTFDDTPAKRSALAKILHTDPANGRLDALAGLNQQGAGIFVCINATDGKGRRAHNVERVRALFLDLDGAPLEPVLTAGLEPHCVVESSPGKYHVYWCCDDCPLDKFERVQRALARRFNGDPSVHDLPRVLRVPGFLHSKGEPFMSHVVEGLGFNGPPYSLSEVVGGLQLQLAAKQQGSECETSSSTVANEEWFAPGGRNGALFQLAGKLRRDGLTKGAIEAALTHMNIDRCRPPLDVAEVKAIAASVTRYDAGSLPKAEAWPAPLLPSSVGVPSIPCDLLPGVWGAFAAALARSTQTPEAASTMLLLAMLAAIAQRRYEVAPWDDEYKETLSLWVLVALPSGSRKTSVLGALRAAIDEWEKRQGERLRPEIQRRKLTIENCEARIARLRVDYTKAKTNDERDGILAEQRLVETEKPDELRAPRLTTGDVTPETLQQLLADYSERMAVVTDEAGLFSVLAGLYSGGAAHLDVFLQAWSGASVKVDRSNRRAHLDRPALSMGIALQPDLLQEVAGVRRFRDSGLLARYLFVVPASTVGHRDVRSRTPIPPALAEEYEHAVHQLLDGAEQPATAPRVLPFTAEAREVWLDLQERIEVDMRAGGRLEPVADWASKLGGQAARMAALMQIGIDGPDAAAVNAEMVTRAVRIADLLIAHALAAFRMLGADGVEGDALHLLRWIEAEQPMEFDRPRAQKAMEGRFRNVDRLKAAAVRLAEWHVLSDELKRPNAGARPTPYYRVNPRLFDESSNSLRE